MSSVTLKDLSFSISIPEARILNRIQEISEKINIAYRGKTPVFIIMLNGGYMFGTEITSRFTGNCEVEFLKLSSYSGIESTGVVNMKSSPTIALSDRHIIILEDIVDTGRTITHAVEWLKQKNCASVEVCTLLFKPDCLVLPFTPDYIGFEIPADFVVGFGLDYDGLGRNLRNIYTKI